MRLLLRLATPVGCAVLFAACSEPVTDPPLELAVVFQVVSGGGQEGPPGQELASPLVVQALDERGNPIGRQVVNFRVVEGGGSVWAGTSLTDHRGLAQEYWTLGLEGAQKVEVRAVDPTTGARHVFAEFTATLSTSLIDADGDGFTSDVDCDDNDPTIHPDAIEIADGIDNDCDGDIDEGFDPVPPTLGDLVINEIMFDPDGDDSNGEWVEVLNVSSTPIDLSGSTLFIADQPVTMPSVILAPDDFIVFARGTALPLDVGGDLVHRYSDAIAMDNLESEELKIWNGSDELVDLTFTFPSIITTFASQSLDPVWATAATNDNASSWCEGKTTYEAGSINLGSPGAANPPC